MLSKSENFTLSADDGVATLRLHFPGEVVNGWSIPRVRECLRLLDLIERQSALEILVIGSGRTDGFGTGFDPEALMESEAPALARAGQELCERLRIAPFRSIAFLEGPCVGPAWDFALACDDCLAVAGPDSVLGFGSAPTGWGGATYHGPTPLHFPRESKFIHKAFCERRAKIELQLWIDAKRDKPPRRRQSWRSPAAGLARERQAFVEAERHGYPPAHRSFGPLPKSIRIAGDSALALEYAARGVRVQFEGRFTGTAAMLTHRGRLTPLEAETALKLIEPVPVRVAEAVPALRLKSAA